MQDVQVEVPNAWARAESVIRSHFSCPESLAGESVGDAMRSFAIKWKRKFSDVEALLGFKIDPRGRGKCVGAWHRQGRQLIYDSILKQEKWSAPRFGVEVASLMPRSETGEFNIVRIEMIAVLQAGGMKRKSRLKDRLTTPCNRGELDSDEFTPRFYTWPQDLRFQEARAKFRMEVTPVLESLVDVGGLRLFTMKPNELLASANRKHGEVTVVGVQAYVNGMAEAEQEARSTERHEEITEQFATWCDDNGMPRNEQSANIFLSARGILPDAALVARMVA